jgi:hypothetical protein
MRFVAMGICLALGIGAAITVGKEIADVFPDPRWLPFAAGGGVGAVVFAALFFPLLRPIADMVRDRVSTSNRQGHSTRTGTGLDDVPLRRDPRKLSRRPRGTPPPRRARSRRPAAP